MTSTTTEVRVKRTVLQGTRRSLKNIRPNDVDREDGMRSVLNPVPTLCQGMFATMKANKVNEVLSSKSNEKKV